MELSSRSSILDLIREYELKIKKGENDEKVLTQLNMNIHYDYMFLNSFFIRYFRDRYLINLL
jgi:hypothetical protein